MKYIKDLPHQVILAVLYPIDNGCFNEEAWDSFMNDKIERVKDVIIKNNSGIDEFIVFNDTDGIPAFPEVLSFDKAIEFITAFPKRFEAQGYYSSNNGRIPANEVELQIHYTEYSEEGYELEPEEDYPSHID
jgi:hypothetical protein